MNFLLCIWLFLVSSHVVLLSSIFYMIRPHSDVNKIHFEYKNHDGSHLLLGRGGQYSFNRPDHELRDLVSGEVSKYMARNFVYMNEQFQLPSIVLHLHGEMDAESFQQFHEVVASLGLSSFELSKVSM